MSDLNNEAHMITLEYENFYLINIYVPNSGEDLITLPRRLQWNQDFLAYSTNLDKTKPIVICGDLNIAHREIDLADPQNNSETAGFTKIERDGMTELQN